MKRFCIPPRHSGAFVQGMEDVLEVYHRPYDARFPVVCFDETNKQLLEHVRIPIRARPGIPARVDDEYKRRGTANIFLAVEPLTGDVHIEATERRTASDCAAFLRSLADDVYPDAEKIVLVGDNFVTHTAACFYETYPPAEARRLTKRFAMHHTPKHGSWLNVAECQLSIVARQCLDQRIESIDQLEKVLATWGRNRKRSRVNWQFTTADARIKLRRLYPIISKETKH